METTDLHTPAQPGEAITSKQTELHAVRKDGFTFPVDVSLSHYHSGGQDYRVAFVTDISKRVATEKFLKAQKEELEIANRELESFTYTVSHDLRAPLRAVNGFAQILENEFKEVLSMESNRYLNHIQVNALRMGVLIDDLLAFSRLGKKEVSKSLFNMNEVVNRSLNELKPITPDKTIITVQPLHNAWVDISLISQVVTNLLSNAIKYSSKNENPRILIESEMKPGYTIFKISDNGAGFDMKYAHKLFGVFQRLHNHTEFEGTGVGLAIAQRIMHKHGGKIWAEGEVDRGASFYFSLPTPPGQPNPNSN